MRVLLFFVVFCCFFSFLRNLHRVQKSHNEMDLHYIKKHGKVNYVLNIIFELATKVNSIQPLNILRCKYVCLHIELTAANLELYTKL